MRRILNLAIIPLFLLGLWLPFIDSFAGWDPTPEFVERRQLAPKPQWQWDAETVAAFPKAFESYYNDHFGWRNSLVHAQVWLKAAILRVPTTAWVILGKEDWTFLGQPRIMASYRCTHPFTDKQLRNLQAKYEQQRDIVEKAGGRYLVTRGPNKHTIYPEYLPDWLTKVGEVSNLDQILDHMAAHSDVTVLDLRPAILAEKEKHRVYLKTNSHWNSVGGYVAYGAIMERTQAWLPNPRVLTQEDIEVRLRPRRRGDPGVMIKIDLYKKVDVYDARAKTYTSHRLGNKIEGLSLPGYARVDVFENDNPNLPRLVMFHDSFGLALIPYLTETFGRVVLVRAPAFSKEIIEHERPDLVINLRVERNLVLNLPFIQ